MLRLFAPTLSAGIVLALGAVCMITPLKASSPDPVGAFCIASADPGRSPFEILMEPTGEIRGATGTVQMRFAPSPFGVALTVDGHFIYDLTLTTQGLTASPRTSYVVWAATPELDQVTKLGTLSDTGIAHGRVSYNKFLVFVTEEASADVEVWAGPVVLHGVSRSGLLHTMAGHGPFNAAPCF